MPARTDSPIRRAFDLVVACVALVLVSPLLLVCAALIWIESGRPILFRQERMGLNGQRFHLIKLRGMYVDARERHPERYSYGECSPDEYARLFHSTRDPRVTKVGRILRKFSIDELPNLWNVIRGDMSIVGPRPEIPEVGHLYGADLATILSVKPGLTSPAKAKAGPSRTFEENVALDLDYVRNRTLAKDVLTIIRTVGAVLRGR